MRASCFLGGVIPSKCECFSVLKSDPLSLWTFPPWPDIARLPVCLLAMEKCELLSPGLSNEEPVGGTTYQPG